MDFIDQLSELSKKAADLKDELATEEVTKNALVLPFLRILGYDVFNPHEVVPEFASDVGDKKAKKVDYAILQDGQPVVLVECKPCGDGLNTQDAWNQLYFYFSVTASTRFAIVTNGVVYRFYTDLESSHLLDERPFLEVNLVALEEPLVEELKKFAKEAFDVGAILSTASEEEKLPVDDVDDLYQYSDRLTERACRLVAEFPSASE